MSTEDKHIEPFYIENTRRGYANIRKPDIIGEFSLDEERKFIDGDKNLKLIKNFFEPDSDTADVDFNLTVGYNERKPRKNEGMFNIERLNGLFEWILLNKEKLYNKERNSIQADFVCLRGRLREVMLSPYRLEGLWIMRATKLNGTIYLTEVESEDKISRRRNRSDQQQRFMSYGLKFEQYMAEETGPINESEEYDVVAKTKIGLHHILFAAEIDGVDGSTYDTERNIVDYIELKSTKEPEFGRNCDYFERYMFKRWWAQCALVGIEKVICGFRNPDGIIEELQSYVVEELPELGKGWHPIFMVNVLLSFLDWIKKAIQLEYPVVYEFQNESVYEIICSSVKEMDFFPSHYIKTLFPNNELKSDAKNPNTTENSSQQTENTDWEVLESDSRGSQNFCRQSGNSHQGGFRSNMTTVSGIKNQNSASFENYGNNFQHTENVHRRGRRGRFYHNRRRPYQY